MLKMRLTRMGTKDKAHYRIVVVDARSKRDGRYVENLGFYNPRTAPSTISVKMDRADYWIGVGAQPTESVASLLVRARAAGQATEGGATVVAPAPATATPVVAPPVVVAPPAPVVAQEAPAPVAEVVPVAAADAPSEVPAVEVGEVTATPDTDA